MFNFDSKLGEKRKEGEGKEKKGKEREGKRGKRLPYLFKKEGKGKERKIIFLLNLFSYEEILMLTKLKDLIPPNIFLSNPSPSLFAV